MFDIVRSVFHLFFLFQNISSRDPITPVSYAESVNDFLSCVKKEKELISDFCWPNVSLHFCCVCHFSCEREYEIEPGSLQFFLGCYILNEIILLIESWDIMYISRLIYFLSVTKYFLLFLLPINKKWWPVCSDIFLLFSIVSIFCCCYSFFKVCLG